MLFVILEDENHKLEEQLCAIGGERAEPDRMASVELNIRYFDSNQWQVKYFLVKRTTAVPKIFRAFVDVKLRDNDDGSSEIEAANYSLHFRFGIRDSSNNELVVIDDLSFVRNIMGFWKIEPTDNATHHCLLCIPVSEEAFALLGLQAEHRSNAAFRELQQEFENSVRRTGTKGSAKLAVTRFTPVPGSRASKRLRSN